MKRFSEALRISLLYVVVASAWIGLTDLVTSLLASDTATLNAIQLIKGWGFVAITGLLLFQLINRALRSLKRSNAETARAREHLQTLFDSLPSGLQELNCDGIITYANAAYCRMTGFSENQLVGHPIWELLPDPDAQARFRNYLQELVTLQPPPTPYPGLVRCANGNVLQVQVDWNYRRAADDRLLGFIAIVSDVTVQREMELQVRQLSQFQQSVIESADIWINALDKNANITLWNEAAERISGYRRQEVLGNGRIWQWLYPDEEYRESISEKVAAILQEGERVSNLRTCIHCKDGSTKIIAWNSRDLTDEDNAVIGSLAIGRDVTAEVAAENALRESENRFRQLFEDSKAVELLIDPADGRIIDANKAARDYYGYSPEQFRQLHIYDINTLSQEETDTEMARAHSERRDHFFFRHRLASGEVRDVEVHSGPIELGDHAILYSIVHDITERRRAEAAVVESEQRFRRLFERAPVGYQSLDSDGRIVEVNQSWLDEFEMTRDEVVGRPFRQFISADSLERFDLALTHLRTEGELHDFVLDMMPSGTQTISVSLSGRVSYDDQHNVSQIHCILIDITERIRSRQQLIRTNRALSTLSQCNEALVHAGSEQELLQRITRLLIDVGGYSAAWVGFGDSRKLVLAATSARIMATTERLQRLYADRLLHCDLVTTTLNTAQPQFRHSIKCCPEGDFWGEMFEPGHPAYALAALPLKAGGATLGLLCVYADDVAAFDEREMPLLEELANDLAYGINMQRTGAERDQMRGALSETLLQTIRALALTVEKRDPYTAGHQERVSRLASAIASAMGMPPEQVEGIRLGGIIHDIGKIYIPAEILNRPGRLTNTEFAIIKTHPEVGHDIMKDVHFPWPVQEMILQHHERLDGSGYPHGLKGEEILLEARILAVADVVEAISSHRPYRPSRGIEAAVEEM